MTRLAELLRTCFLGVGGAPIVCSVQSHDLLIEGKTEPSPPNSCRLPKVPLDVEHMASEESDNDDTSEQPCAPASSAKIKVALTQELERGPSLTSSPRAAVAAAAAGDAAISNFHLCATGPLADRPTLPSPLTTSAPLSSPGSAATDLARATSYQTCRSQGGNTPDLGIPRRRINMSASGHRNSLSKGTAIHSNDSVELACYGLSMMDKCRDSPGSAGVRQRMSGFAAAATLVRMVASDRLDSCRYSPIRRCSGEASTRWASLVESANRRYSMDVVQSPAPRQRAC